LHLLLASPGYDDYFKNLHSVIVDEWHELIGSKRGVLMELALSRLKSLQKGLRIWGISATIGNMDEALEVLLGKHSAENSWELIKADIPKEIEIITLAPDEIERFPWAGHMGVKMLEKVIPVIHQSETTVIFTNTRNQCEVWYQNLVEEAPEFLGLMAMHHSSIDREQREWVEQALDDGKLKVVVSTSSLDLGVDFRSVETVVQVGSPKGVARFLQRAGRSGHRPGALSRIYFVPTHSLELIEAAALRSAVEENKLEQRIPYIRSFDVLAQYLVTLSVSNGFVPEEIYQEVKATYCFDSITPEEWNWVLSFITTGGPALTAYDEFKRVGLYRGKFHIVNKNLATRHRLSIGAIVSDASLTVKYISGGRIGHVEERFISNLKPGDVFWFAGRSLELVQVRNMEVRVKKSKSKTGKVPAWVGGRVPLSSQLGDELRKKIAQISYGEVPSDEIEKVMPLTELQIERSYLPNENEFLVEYFQSKEGYHLLFYPFEGRYVHEGMSALFAWRIAQLQPISFSIAFNDYGFELLSDIEIPIEKALEEGLLSATNLHEHIGQSINAVEMARRRFRDIASISGLVFKGYPGREKKDKHLQSSSQLFFDAFSSYEPDNLLLQQAFEEVMTFQLESERLYDALKRISNQELLLSRPGRATPLAFPIMVDRLREKLSSEKLEDRIEKMKLRLIKD
ncbi:MAG: ligase-associated DNA damage response DEXH box helicase, partial [Saprospiraceae bacterium]|nr:ligase-associated DNA damage response DEXH box helicase [Saprospiraceae bacterium]